MIEKCIVAGAFIGVILVVKPSIILYFFMSDSYSMYNDEKIYGIYRVIEVFIKMLILYYVIIFYQFFFACR